MQASTPFIMSWTCFGSFSNPAVSFQGRCRKERRDWGNYRSLGQRIEDRLRSPTYLRAPQTQTPSRALTGRSVRVNGREIETKSVLRMCPLKLLLWCFFCSSGLEVTAVSLFISVWEEHTTTQEAEAGLDRFSAVITAFVSDKKKGHFRCFDDIQLRVSWPPADGSRLHFKTEVRSFLSTCQFQPANATGFGCVRNGFWSYYTETKTFWLHVHVNCTTTREEYSISDLR